MAPAPGATGARTAVVTDSTAQLGADAVAALGVTVVPLQVVIGEEVHDECTEAGSAERVTAALRARERVSTSRPGPAVFEEVYAGLVAGGAEEILSVHLSGAVSGTYESALIAARSVGVPIRTVDTRQVGPATGYAVAAAVARLREGANLDAAAKAARERAAAAVSYFYVDSLEYLRRGGRVGAAAGLLGGVLAVKPILTVENGTVAGKEKVRTASRALARLGDLAVEAAGDRPVEIGVAHLANPDAAGDLTALLEERLGDRLDGRSVSCSELSAVLGVHAGPGTVAVCVSPLD
ncbi:DegV family protein [Nocardioides zeae]|uniref:DegV family protein n=1 Tax=Nocardioides imazamoxiresistens TaxID=3231893 RepID=A0ABU3Q2D2_9ACTN|nr:DegV family protein [Nocardioides zeae]MDT9595197.1 DegV family protein [Nocardioides zeae]